MCRALSIRKSSQYERIENVHHESLFVINAAGIQIARTPYSAESVGSNFAFRDYFHGMGRELPQEEKGVISETPVLSAAYVSSVGGQVRTAFSVPIKTIENGRERTIARLCMSVLINELKIFKDLGGLPIETVLVETREYASGLIIDCPNLQAVQTNKGSSAKPSDRINELPKIPADCLEKMTSNWDTSSAGAQFCRDISIPALHLQDAEVAFMPIHVPNRAEESTATGWYVLLFEKTVAN